MTREWGGRRFWAARRKRKRSETKNAEKAEEIRRKTDENGAFYKEFAKFFRLLKICQKEERIGAKL